jgi:alpha-tubulin suppressor-like RCC1 family protein
LFAIITHLIAVWGSNWAGQLYVPFAVGNIRSSNVKAIAGGTYHSLALKNNGTVRAWGENQSGQLGDGTYTNSAVPVTVSGLNGVTAIAGGSSYSLAK